MKKRCLLKLMVLALCVIPVLAVASEPVEAAEHAVRKLIHAKLGRDYRVAFDQHSEKFLSLNEEIVEGNGHVYDGNSWDYDRGFKYTVKVKYDGSSTRGLVVTFTNGERHADVDSWVASDHGETAVHLTRPRAYERLDSGRVVFEGTSRSSVRIYIYNRSGNRVADETASVSDGKFRVSVDLGAGQYRAIVSTRGSDPGDEVRFSVADNGGDWGHPTAYLKIGEPRKDARLSGSRVSFTGNSSERTVWLQVWDSRNNRVIDQDISVKDRYWQYQARLDDGNYRFTVKSGENHETRQFTVDTGSYRPGQPSGGQTLTVTSPESDARFTTSDVTVSGNSTERSVRVRIWDARDNRVVDREVPVRDRYWNTRVVMDDGTYKVTVSAGDRTMTRYFQVKAGKGKPTQPMVRVRVNEPKRDSTVRGPRVTVAGASTEDSVGIHIWDERNRSIVERRVQVSGGSWRTTFDLDKGRYRIRVTPAGAQDREEFWFTVR